jgi:hypothetical protein
MKNLNLQLVPEPASRILTELIKGLDSAAPGLVDGLYIPGSISLNDFHPTKSDIDFIISCKELPDAMTASTLRKLHQGIQKRYPKPDLSGCYIAIDSLLAEDVSSIKVLSWHQRKMKFQFLEMAPVLLYELKNSALTLFGPDWKNLNVNIDRNVLNDFMLRNVSDYWQNWIDAHSDWFRRKLLLWLFPGFTEWSVLGLARIYCTLQTGRIVSKTEGGNYCLEEIPSRFHPIIHRAIEIRKDERVYPIVGSYAIRPSIKRMKATLEFVSFLVGKFDRC